MLCRIGFHKLEENPSLIEEIKSTGDHFASSSRGIQKAIKKCLRKDCRFTLKVYREGWVGAGGIIVHGWKKLNPSREKYIDSLPGINFSVI